MTFNVEYLIAFYMLVSIMMIVFNFGFLAYEKMCALRFDRKMADIASSLVDEIDRNVDFPTDEHRNMLVRRMSHLSGMESFDLAMGELLAIDGNKSERYLAGIASVFERLSYVYKGKDDLHCAYFAYIVGRWYRGRPASSAVAGVLLHYVRERSFYARQNALTALAALGSVDDLLDGVEAIGNLDEFHHPKLVTETLLAFSGHRRVLADRAMSRFEGLPPAAQVAVVNFMRMEDAAVMRRKAFAVFGKRMRDHCAWAYALLVGEGTHPEVRLAAVRYFMGVRYEPAGPALREMVVRDDAEHWELSAVAASALASYPGSETVKVLKRCVSSRQWYVRNNSAKSLVALDVPFEDMLDVVNGPDPYAADMVRYRWSAEGRAGA